MKGNRRGRHLGGAAVALPLLWGALVGLSPADCPPVESAWEELVAGGFEVERSFRMTVNDDLKRREVARLRYAAGELETEILEEETLSKLMVFEPDDTDLALEVGFACERVEDLGEGRFSIVSENEEETAIFALDAERGALRPESWRLEAKARFLLKKLAIVGVADYSNFRWRDLDPQLPPDQ